MATINEVAEEIGISHWSLRDRMKARGIKGRKAGGIIVLNEADTERLKEGMPAKEEETAADTTSVSSISSSCTAWPRPPERSAPLPPIQLEVERVTRGGIEIRLPIPNLLKKKE